MDYLKYWAPQPKLGGGWICFKDDPAPVQAPAPVDPSIQIAAQARALPSVYGPGGTQVYSGDPNVAGSFARTDTLSPAEQTKYNQKNVIASQLLGRTSQAIGALPAGNYKFNGATDPTTNQAFQAQQALLDPVFKKNEEQLTQRLANQGLPTGSEAYDEEFRNFRQSKDAAYQQAAASAQQQGYQQDIGTRQQQFNEIAQALGGSQLTPIGQSGNPIDTTSAYAANQAQQNQQYQSQLANYNAGVASNNSQMNGLFQLGAAALPLMFSDRRLKRDIELLGELVPGVNWYAFNYTWDDLGTPPRQGFMADEIERFWPEAIVYTDDGFAMVNYGMLLGGRTVH